MNLVNKHDGASAVLSGSLRIRHYLLDFFDPGEHGAELDEICPNHACDDFRQSRLSSAGWAPKDQRSDVVALQLSAQRFAGSDQVFLTDKLIQRARPHAICKRSATIG